MNVPHPDRLLVRGRRLPRHARRRPGIRDRVSPPPDLRYVPCVTERADTGWLRHQLAVSRVGDGNCGVKLSIARTKRPCPSRKWTVSAARASAAPAMRAIVRGRRCRAESRCSAPATPPCGPCVAPTGHATPRRLARYVDGRWPREESNLRPQIRSLPLYPLSYGASRGVCPRGLRGSFGFVVVADACEQHAHDGRVELGAGGRMSSVRASSTVSSSRYGRDAIAE